MTWQANEDLIKSVEITASEAYAAGRAAGEEACSSEFWRNMAESCMAWAKRSYLASADLDYKSALIRLETERLTAGLDLTKFPECRGLREVVEAEHRGFLEGCGEDWMMAYQFNWYWFVSRRLNTRFVRATAPTDKCTAIWFRDSSEGPLQGDNLDDIRRSFETFEPPTEGPAGTPVTQITCMGGVSSAVHCGEEKVL